MTTPSATPLAGDAPPRFVPPAPRVKPVDPEPGRFVAAACLVGAIAGASLPFHELGLGMALTAVAVLTVAGWRLAEGRWRTFCLTAAGILALTPAYRAADWVVNWALLGAVLLAAIGLPAASSWREIGRAAWWWVAELLPASATLLIAARTAAVRRRLGAIGPVARGLLIAAPLVLVFGALFASADATFSALVDDLSRFDALWPTGMELRLSVAVAVTILVLALRAAARRERAEPAAAAATPGRILTRVEWGIALASLVGLFALFVALQLRVLFGDDDYVMRQAGLTYAEYARRGFGQLTAVAALTLAVLATVGARGPATDRLVRLLCAALCLLTLVIVASAWHRLSLYESAYGATRLRLQTHLALLWFAGTFALVLAAGAVHRGTLLPRAIVALTACLLVGFVVADPDRRIADTNVDRAIRTGSMDEQYTYDLSADAAPALMRLDARRRACPLSWLITSDRSIAGWNRARERANTLAASDPAAQFCAAHRQAPPGP
ncbi:MAG: DUF4173 domain-containing protein [Solirubrobacteraceae bacterium]|nr:DUF4173 domain-containing protein [Solirubrobacteraceae bacterium]